MQHQLDSIMAEFSTSCAKYFSKYNPHFRPCGLTLIESTNAVVILAQAGI
ncbi:hypothetical protein SAMN05421827_12941 [Pedobacter terrae]|uniref:Uncharacterized protein n=1 Tax=Pedobacter terrae TaxID=405671 RepID=A0A1G8DI65_9SPHI|nr:hypothetical protein SAMN05421827_12941 [Pedobacter terrae]